jgi:uncharacterized repeat protein (TIGR03803 family)
MSTIAQTKSIAFWREASLLRCLGVCCKYLLVCGLASSMWAAASAQAYRFRVLYNFTQFDHGLQPRAGVILDDAGNLYGTTMHGGFGGVGTLFKLAPNGTETVLYDFQSNGKDGLYPGAPVVADAAGNLYGTTTGGGNGTCGNGYGCGTVFEGATVLHAFTAAGGDGYIPESGLILDQSGNLYGTTYEGGGGSGCNGNGCGTVFRLSPSRRETVLHTFVGGTDGSGPEASLMMDQAGNLFGTTSGGGAYSAGIVFKLAPDGTETVLHSFGGEGDGKYPQSRVIADRAGNLYGTTYTGGGGVDCGTVFKLAPDGTETVLYAFKGSPDGCYPYAGLLRRNGILYGTTVNGGSLDGWGTIFALATDGTETVLHRFHIHYGAHPYGDLVADRKGNLYGTTFEGGYCKRGCGTVFEISP